MAKRQIDLTASCYVTGNISIKHRDLTNENRKLKNAAREIQNRFKGLVD